MFDKTYRKEPKFEWMASLPSWLVPKQWMKFALLEKFLRILSYGREYAYEDIPNATKFYCGLNLTVGQKTRGLGLGTELIKRTNAIAKEKDCSHVYILSTSFYSQAIFKKLNFQLVQEQKYGEFKNKDGSDFFIDMREHKNCQVVVFDLS